MKQFVIPDFYRSPVISKIKKKQAELDPRRESLAPTILDLGPVRFKIARHFGFCYGVENAIEIAFRAIAENPGKRIYLISQMIHNPEVNKDLISRGVQFLMDTEGKVLIPLSEVTEKDIVLIPAFGASLKVLDDLVKRGIEVKKYDTTCPFVERVWNKAVNLGGSGHTIIVHGKAEHEETRATFSRSEKEGPSLIVLNLEEAKLVTDYMEGLIPKEQLLTHFKGKVSEGFNPERDLQKVGVINQTTMLATETEEIARHFKEAMFRIHGSASTKERFADTRDTLCYATNQNQDSTYELLVSGADIAIVVGGYNSSNTTHLAEICKEKIPTFFISSADSILSAERIAHFDLSKKAVVESGGYLPSKPVVNIILTSGASCPDSIVDAVLKKLAGYFSGAETVEEGMKKLGIYS